MSSWSEMTSYNQRKFYADLLKSAYFYFGLISGCISTGLIRKMYRRELAIKFDENDVSQKRQLYHTAEITRNKQTLHKIKYFFFGFASCLVTCHMTPNLPTRAKEISLDAISTIKRIGRKALEYRKSHLYENKITSDST